MELLQSHAPADRELLGNSAVRTSDIGVLGGVDESQKCISTGPYERFYGLKMLC